MCAAKPAAVGENDPVERLFDSVSHAYAAKIDRPAMRTAIGEHGSGALALLPRLAVVTARFTGGFDLFVRSEVGLGKFHAVFGA